MGFCRVSTSQRALYILVSQLLLASTRDDARSFRDTYLCQGQRSYARYRTVCCGHPGILQLFVDELDRLEFVVKERFFDSIHGTCIPCELDSGHK